MERGELLGGQGAGRLLGLAMVGEFSSTAMESALLCLGSLVDIMAALAALYSGVGGNAQVLLLGAWLAFAAWLCWRYKVQMQRWMASYRTVTQDTVERMVGDQTRLMQERPEEGQQEEDVLLHDYLKESQELDRRPLPMESLLSAGWLILAIAALEPVFLSGAQNGASIAVTLGCILMAGGALRHLVPGVIQLIDVWVSW